MHPTLRFATLEDIPAIMKIAEELYKTSPYRVFKLNPDKARAMLEKAIVEGPKKFLVLLSYHADKVVGVLVAYAYTPIFSSTQTCNEILWYLTPEYRTGKRGLAMMKAYEYWARKAGCEVIQYGILSTSPEGMKKLYERNGLVEVERFYNKAL